MLEAVGGHAGRRGLDGEIQAERRDAPAPVVVLHLHEQPRGAILKGGHGVAAELQIVNPRGLRRPAEAPAADLAAAVEQRDEGLAVLLHGGAERTHAARGLHAHLDRGRDPDGFDGSQNFYGRNLPGKNVGSDARQNRD